MPSKSEAQARLMRAVAHGWIPKGESSPPVPRKVAEEYMRADMAKHLVKHKKGK